jgi:hypothetical protein
VLDGMDGFRRRVAALPSKQSVMLAVGELEQPSIANGSLQGRLAIAAARHMVDNARELGERLQNASTWGILENQRYLNMTTEQLQLTLVLE